MWDSQRHNSEGRKAVLEDAHPLIPFLELSRKEEHTEAGLEEAEYGDILLQGGSMTIFCGQNCWAPWLYSWLHEPIHV